MFVDGDIDGVEVRRLTKHDDARGWLCEVYRSDEATEEVAPAMAYVSVTRVGVTRGPHEHVAQSDRFVFLGPSSFLVVLWDNRAGSATYRRRMRFSVGEDAPATVVVPPGVVHGYRNVGGVDGVVLNLPNRLFRGVDRREAVDEVRHEDEPGSVFRMDG